MKILMVLSSDKFSGAENVVCQIISMFRDESGYEFIYCSPDGEIKTALEERSITFAPMLDITVKELKRVIKEQKPDVVHAHDMRASFVASRACGKIRLISHIHNNAFDSRGLTLKSVAYLKAGFKANHIFWVSESSYKGYYFHKWFEKKSEVLYNIIDVDALYEKMERDTEKYDYDVVYLGRLTYEKNPQRLIQILGNAIKIKPDLKVAIIGKGALEKETVNLVNEKGLSPNITFKGFMSNPIKVLHDAKVMVMASRWEGTPMCALEAMALGVPIVSTPVDGLKDLVVNDETGYLSDDDTVLAESIVKIVENKDLSEKLSHNALTKARKFNDISLYRETLKKQY